MIKTIFKVRGSTNGIINKYSKSSQRGERHTLCCSERMRICIALRLFNSFIVHHSSSPLTRQLHLMAKLKKKSSILRFVKGDFNL